MKIIKKGNWIIVMIIFAITCLIIWPPGTQYFTPLGDATDYWNRGINLWGGEHTFSLENIDGFRGYFWPLFLGVCNQIGGYRAFAIINAFIITVYFIYILPLFCGKIENTIYNKIGGCVVYGLFAVTFWGLFRYPLSDLMALILCTLSVLFMEKAIDKDITIIRTFINAILAGAFIYLAYNTRTIYMFAGMALFICFIVQILKYKKNIKTFIVILLGNIIGGCTMAIPQIYMNWKNLGIISGKVPTNGLIVATTFLGNAISEI